MIRVRDLLSAFFIFLASAVFGQQPLELRSDTVNLDLKDVSVQLINLRDSIGAELMAIDKRLIRAPQDSRMNLEKSKCKLNIYKAELEKLVEEITVADISYLTEVKKRSYRTVREVRKEFLKVLAEVRMN